MRKMLSYAVVPMFRAEHPHQVGVIPSRRGPVGHSVVGIWERISNSMPSQTRLAEAEEVEVLGLGGEAAQHHQHRARPPTVEGTEPFARSQVAARAESWQPAPPGGGSWRRRRRRRRRHARTRASTCAGCCSRRSPRSAPSRRAVLVGEHLGKLTTTGRSRRRAGAQRQRGRRSRSGRRTSSGGGSPAVPSSRSSIPSVSGSAICLPAPTIALHVEQRLMTARRRIRRVKIAGGADGGGRTRLRRDRAAPASARAPRRRRVPQQRDVQRIWPTLAIARLPMRDWRSK